jgi:uncharacterized membrane protein YphA (DoxX/SURF4 family)
MPVVAPPSDPSRPRRPPVSLATSSVTEPSRASQNTINRQSAFAAAPAIPVISSISASPAAQRVDVEVVAPVERRRELPGQPRREPRGVRIAVEQAGALLLGQEFLLRQKGARGLRPQLKARGAAQPRGLDFRIPTILSQRAPVPAPRRSEAQRRPWGVARRLRAVGRQQERHPMTTSFLHALRRTGSAKWPIAPRLVAALPLAGFGSFHLTGMTPLMEILELAGIPFPSLNYVLAPALMVLAGLSLGLGFYARLGAVLGIGAMTVATYSKLVITEWPGPVEPPLALPLVVMAACVIVLVVGAGAWSLDHRAMQRQGASWRA